jgi:hypothetical protein
MSSISTMNLKRLWKVLGLPMIAMGQFLMITLGWRRARLRARGCLATYRQKAYELSSPPPDVVTVVRAGHPLCGQQLRVDHGGGRRHDGNVQVVLPDGSPSLIPLRWTDAVDRVGTGADAAVPGRFSLEGLRRLVRLVDAMAGGDGPKSSAT